MHTAVAVQGMAAETVDAVLADWQSAPIDERLRATLGFLQKLTLAPASVCGPDVDLMREAGVSSEAIEDAIHVCYVFSVLTRLADAFDFELTSPSRWRVGGIVFNRIGYAATSIPG